MAQSFQSEIRRLAYDQTPGLGPGIVFLGGFRSDKSGTKARHLEDWAKGEGRAFLRFDYSGHGDSAGDFLDGTVGIWADDAVAIIEALTEGPQVLVGSSMGGWIALLLARRMPERIAGLVTIAAAPDFTEEKYWQSLTGGQRAALDRDGRIEVPSEYDDGPYVITRALIEDGRNHLVLTSPLALPMPTRFLYGTADTAVSQATAVNLFDHAEGGDIRLTLVKGADHRFSTPECLNLITQAIAEVTRAITPA